MDKDLKFFLHSLYMSSLTRSHISACKHSWGMRFHSMVSPLRVVQMFGEVYMLLYKETSGQLDTVRSRFFHGPQWPLSSFIVATSCF